jgi:hypothetical protein
METMHLLDEALSSEVPAAREVLVDQSVVSLRVMRAGLKHLRVRVSRQGSYNGLEAPERMTMASSG